MRLVVARAAPVTMFVAPGPIDVVTAMTCSAVAGAAKAVAVWTAPCSLRAR